MRGRLNSNLASNTKADINAIAGGGGIKDPAQTSFQASPARASIETPAVFDRCRSSYPQTRLNKGSFRRKENHEDEITWRQISFQPKKSRLLKVLIGPGPGEG